MASGPNTSWQIEWEKMETVSDFIFLGSKITAGGNCSHEIKRHLLLGKKAMKNLESVLKSRDITLLITKVYTVKVMVFSGVMYWRKTTKKAGCQRIDAFKLWGWRRLLRVPWTARRSNHSILKEINSEYWLERLMMKLKLHYFGHLMWRADSLEKTLMLGKIESNLSKGEGGGKGELVRQHHWLNRHEFEQTLRVTEGKGNWVCCSPWGHMNTVSDWSTITSWKRKKEEAFLFPVTTFCID